MKIPRKPFSNYKWRWATLTPTEGLNDPSVFLGVLRVLKDFEGQPPATAEFSNALNIVRNETKTRVNLARTPERNIIRNSGQYWKMMGLYAESHGLIELTELGRNVADGNITKTEMAALIVKRLELPNQQIQADTEVWDLHRIKIKPLELILAILSDLEKSKGHDEAYLTTSELVKIVIPLAGTNASRPDYTEALLTYRRGELDLSEWPDCAPSPNDPRMAREFLLFLYHYGFCDRTSNNDRMTERYYLSVALKDDISRLVDTKPKGSEPRKLAEQVRQTDIPALIERKKIITEVLERPYQAKFRRLILGAYRYRCMITCVSLEAVLEAAHILPIRKKGLDSLGNGLCLRSDIHLLFDSGHLRIHPTGRLQLSDAASDRANYEGLPKAVEIPSFVKREFLEWRWKYW